VVKGPPRAQLSFFPAVPSEIEEQREVIDKLLTLPSWAEGFAIWAAATDVNHKQDQPSDFGQRYRRLA